MQFANIKISSVAGTLFLPTTMVNTAPSQSESLAEDSISYDVPDFSLHSFSNPSSSSFDLFANPDSPEEDWESGISTATDDEAAITGLLPDSNNDLSPGVFLGDDLDPLHVADQLGPGCGKVSRKRSEANDMLLSTIKDIPPSRIIADVADFSNQLTVVLTSVVWSDLHFFQTLLLVSWSPISWNQTLINPWSKIPH